MEKTSGSLKVVIQLNANDPAIQKSLIGQVNNILKALGNIPIEVMAHGAGVDLLLQGSSMKNNVELLNEKGVVFLICQNTLNDRKVEITEFLPFCKVVPSGVAHIIVRQSEGWSYLKVG